MRRLLSLLLAAVVLAAPACDRGGDDDASPSGTAQQVGTARPGGVLRVGITADVSLDPAQARTVEQLLVADQVFDGLTGYKTGSMEPEPVLVERWESSPDQTVWNFFLRSGITFSNGRPITATDVKYSLERVAKQGPNSPGGELLELVVGFKEYAVQSSAPELAGIQVVNDQLVRIVITRPWALLPSALASPVFGVVPRESVEAQPPTAPFDREPQGSGPFAFRERDSRHISLVKSSGSSGKRAHLDGVELLLFPDVAGSYDAFTKGNLDWSRVPPEQVRSAGDRYGDDQFRPYVAELFYAFNLRHPKLSSGKFREAIVRAVDRRAIVRAVYDDISLPLNSIVVRGVPGYQDNACGEKCSHDVGRARRLIAEAFPTGNVPEISLDYDEDTVQEAVAKSIQADLKDVGVTATLRPRPLADYQNFALSGEQEVFRLGWIAAYPSQDAFLTPLFISGSASNLIGMAVPVIDDLLRAARGEPDPATRQKKFQDVERIILEQLPLIPITQFEIHAVVSKRVRALDLLPTGVFDAARVWLAR